MKLLAVQGLKAWFDFDIIADLVDECRLQVPYIVMSLRYNPPTSPPPRLLQERA